MPEKDVWKSIAQTAVPAIVNIRVAQAFPFDAADSSAFRGTGFVVDKNLGLICTNAHIITGAPLSARATFFEKEHFKAGAVDVNISTSYTDPVHDFAFVRYNTENLKAMKIEASQLSFAQEVKVFQDICIMGNDSGEVIGLLPGIISKVDRNPPNLWDKFNDSMTEYLQGSADVSGGSSGSPVINKNGEVVGMVSAGSFIESTDYYLPVAKMRYVLDCLRFGQLVQRGTLQSTWLSKTRAECDALGVTQKTLEAYGLDKSGLLSVNQILPDGPSHGKVEPGDLLLLANNSRFESIAAFEDLLDRNVRGSIHVLIWRHSQELEYELIVQDASKLAPYWILEWSGNVFHEMHLILAQYYHSPIKGVVIADGQQWGKKVITAIEHRQTPDLETFIDVVRNVPDKKRVLVEYHRPGEKRSHYKKTITVCRSGLCTDMTLRVREDDFNWVARTFEPPHTQTSAIPEVGQITHAISTKKEECRFNTISSCMVGVRIRKTHFEYDVTNETRCEGLVISSIEGLIIIPRQLCPSDLCEVSVIDHSLELPAKVIRSHPLGYVIIHCDLTQSRHVFGEVEFSKKELYTGTNVAIYGLDHATLDNTVVETNVQAIGPVNVSEAPLNVEVLHFKTNPGNFGALIDADGHLQGLCLPFFAYDHYVYVGIPLPYLLSELEALRNKLALLKPRRLHAELGVILHHEARVYTDSHESIINLSGKKVVEVKCVTCETQSEGLKARDLILELDGKPVSRMSDLQKMFVEKTLDLTIIRDKQLLHCHVSTMSAEHATHIVWAFGATFEPPPVHILLKTHEQYSEVFISDHYKGSPASSFNLPVRHFVTKVNGMATKTLDDFVKEVGMLPEGGYCQISTADAKGRERTTAIIPNDFFPCVEARRSNQLNTWYFKRIPSSSEL